MDKPTNRNGGMALAVALTGLVLLALLGKPGVAVGASAAEIEKKSETALGNLVAKNLVAKKLVPDAKGILVFPSIVKGGLMVGGQAGEGVLYKGGKASGYYNTVAVSYGLQAGVQKFGYALLFMDSDSLSQFANSKGFEIGVGPSIVVVDEGVGKALTTETVRKGIYAFIFDQEGLMAGLGIQGSKITKIDKK